MLTSICFWQNKGRGNKDFQTLPWPVGWWLLRQRQNAACINSKYNNSCQDETMSKAKSTTKLFAAKTDTSKQKGERKLWYTNQEICLNWYTYKKIPIQRQFLKMSNHPCFLFLHGWGGGRYKLKKWKTERKITKKIRNKKLLHNYNGNCLHWLVYCRIRTLDECIDNWRIDEHKAQS